MEALLGRITERLPQIEELLAEIADHWGEEDGIYRFYHQSFKVFGLQQITKKAFKLIEEIGGDRSSGRLVLSDHQGRHRGRFSR